jgi:hypothetical protein
LRCFILYIPAGRTWKSRAEPIPFSVVVIVIIVIINGLEGLKCRVTSNLTNLFTVMLFLRKYLLFARLRLRMEHGGGVVTDTVLPVS